MTISTGFNAASGGAAMLGGAVGGTAGKLVGAAAGAAVGALFGAMFGGRRDPDVQFCYMLEIDGLTLGMFTEASGVKWSMETEPIKEGGLNNHEQNLLGRAKFDPLVLKRGFVAKDNMLFGMMKNTFDPNTPIMRKIVHIVCLKRGSNTGVGGLLGTNEIGRITFYNCFVQEWSGPSFNTKTSDVAVESITFKYDWLEFHPGGPLDQLLDAAIGGAMSLAGGMLAGKVPSI